MVAKNDITGDELKSKVNSKAYTDNFELIFGNKNKFKVGAKDEIKEASKTVTEKLETEKQQKKKKPFEGDCI